MSTVPEALVHLLLGYFGTGAVPDYGRTLEIFDQGPYHELRERLASNWTLTDLTDLNYDLGWRWWIERPSDGPIDLRVSFVGPYYLMLDEVGSPTHEGAIETALEAAGLHTIHRQILEREVTIWSPEVGGSLYEYLFQFDSGLPWG